MKLICKEGFYKVLRIENSELEAYKEKGWNECDYHGDVIKQKPKKKEDKDGREPSKDSEAKKERSSPFDGQKSSNKGNVD